jgi:hypothetical protein
MTRTERPATVGIDTTGECKLTISVHTTQTHPLRLLVDAFNSDTGVMLAVRGNRYAGRPWNEYQSRIVAARCSDRILFVHDGIGHTGKSTLARQSRRDHRALCVVISRRTELMLRYYRDKLAHARHPVTVYIDVPNTVTSRGAWMKTLRIAQSIKCTRTGIPRQPPYVVVLASAMPPFALATADYKILEFVPPEHS